MTELPVDIDTAIEVFESAAQAWGWEADQGTGTDTADVLAAFEKARAALDAAILKHLAASVELEAEVTCLTIRAEKAEAHRKELIWQDSEMCRTLEGHVTHLVNEVQDYGMQLAKAKAENARLAAFAREIIGYAFDGHDADGASIQALAVHHGLLVETKYDPKRHGPSFADPGADWCEFAGPLARPAAAEGE